MSRYSYSSDTPLWVYLVALGLLFGAMSIKGIIKVSDEHTETVTVTDKNIKNKDDDSKYLIWADHVDTCNYCGNKGSETYEITDSLFKWRWDSSDLYGQIEVGHTYKITVAGQRWHFFSMYKNIYEIEDVTEEDK